MTKAKLLLGAGALVLAAVVVSALWLGLHETSKPAYAPGRANDKQLIAGGWSGDELRRIIGDFQKTYHQELPSDFSYEVRADGSRQVASFPHDISPWLFWYLINYARYPKGLDPAGRAILVAGASTLSPDFELPAQALYGRKAVFYVPVDDTEYNYVYARTGADAWKISFESAAWTSVTDPRMPPELESLLKN